MARKGYLRVAGVIENMSDFTCEHGTSYALFGSGGGDRLAADVGVPLIGRIPLHPSMSAGGDAGSPVALDGGITAGPGVRRGRRVGDDHDRPSRGHGRLQRPPARAGRSGGGGGGGRRTVSAGGGHHPLREGARRKAAPLRRPAFGPQVGGPPRPAPVESVPEASRSASASS